MPHVPCSPAIVRRDSAAGRESAAARGGRLGRLWSRLQWSIPFAGALVPIVLLSLYAERIASDSVRDLVESEHLTAANNLSERVVQDLRQTVTLASAMASIPLTVEAAQERNVFSMNARLKAVVVAYKSMDHAFVTDAEGILWSQFPSASGSYGASYASHAWFDEVIRTRKPVITGVSLSGRALRNDPVITVAVPIQTSTGVLLGTLVFAYHTRQITSWIQDVKIGHHGYAYVVDHTGTLVAHPALGGRRDLYAGYAGVPAVQDALRGMLHTAEYQDPLEGRRMVATLVPVVIGRNRWVIVAQQPRDSAYAELFYVRRNIVAAGGVLTLITLILVVALARSSARNIRLNRELTAKNATLRDITSFVSHQLRAPVTAMRWSLESVLDGDAGTMADGVREELRKMYEVNLQNAALINDILNISRLDRGVLEVRMAPASLRAIAERAIRDYVVACQKVGLFLRVEAPEGDILVYADADKMAEAVSNAVSNAIKHTKHGGILLRLRTDRDRACIDVVDTGEGMTREVLDTLFDRTGVKSSSTDASQSTGLGLYIAREFMRRMHGDITVRSVPGQGSTFTYVIPLAADTGIAAAPPSSAGGTAPANTSSSGARRVWAALP